MKKIWVAGMAILFCTLGFPLVLQAEPQTSSRTDKKPDVEDSKGTVRSENAKITFVADEGGNPGTC